MFDRSRLESELDRIDGRGYKAYKDIRGSFRMGDFILHIDHVQGDPFAAPSRMCVEIERSKAGFKGDLDRTAPARLALSDFLARAFARAVREVKSRGRGSRGMGKSGLIEIDAGGQEIVLRTATLVTERTIEARFVLGLPARGRTVLGREAWQMLCHEVPAIVKRSLYASALDEDGLNAHIKSVEDWTALQAALDDTGLVAFVADGSVLPRRSGIDPRPLTEGSVVKFKSPPELRVELALSDGQKIQGMGVPRGVTLIVGGGFHGKSTLLDALAKGVYPHVPGDGRELVASLPGAVKIRAEDGRRVESVDISPFIDNLPFGRDTKRFRTDNASGSTSQAANIMEALEMGADVLLVDEDTSATNFMIRDRRMQGLVKKDKEPITPFIDRVQEIRDAFNCSTVMVVGGSGDYFDVADTVIQMDEYVPAEVTGRARSIASEHPTGRAAEAPRPMVEIAPRRPTPDSFDPSRGRREVKIGAKGLKEIHFGKTVLELSALEQMVDVSQTRMIGELIHLYSTKYLNRRQGFWPGIEAMMRDIEKQGLDRATPARVGNLALPRAFEVAAAINRMRTLKTE
jgi:predicted ABC-class ATPase